tara:strand:+ start:131 stop:352 length:222 start_codon:yes stop_codon:yes gene_type:complete
VKIIFSFVFRGIIILYQKSFSPLLRPRCRYIPTCSQYALDAIKKFGPWEGGRLALARFFRCHPWGGHGHDPIP